MADCAPVALFVHARPQHARRTLDMLARNTLAGRTEVTVYADGPRHEGERAAVEAVRSIAREPRGFAALTVVERETNHGLARNIVEGVTALCARAGRVIVLEDDIVTSPHFLAYMNAALARYADEKAVWHISGWNYPVPTEGLGETFFVRVMNCWGWATWQDRWQHYAKDPAGLRRSFDRAAIRRFDLEGTGAFWPQVLDNARGRIDTWAVFWYATIFRHGGLCLNPATSYTDNIGFDGSGTHTPRDDSHAHQQLANQVPQAFDAPLVENTLAIARIRAFYKALRAPLPVRAARRLARVLARARDEVRGRILMPLRRRIHAPRLDVQQDPRPRVRLGSAYGGWTFIEQPGLHGCTIVSCGLGEDASFDVEFAARYGARVVLVDPTPRALRHYTAIRQRVGDGRRAPYADTGSQSAASYDLRDVGADQLHMVPRALWNAVARLRFYAPANPDHVSHSLVNLQGDFRTGTETDSIEVESTTIDRVLREARIDTLQLLKLDIEGAEIEVIEDMLDKGIRPLQLLVEYDELHVPSARSKARVQRCHDALRAAGYRLVHADAPSNFLYAFG